MLSIQLPSTSSPAKKVTPNLLPCSIKHSGPIPTSTRHWNPSPSSPASTQASTFRGRKLLGTPLPLPENYAGVVLQKTEKNLPQAPPPQHTYDGHADGEEELDVEAEVKIMEQTGTFDEVVVWGHETLPTEEDVYVKGLKEWVGFAEAMHDCHVPTEKTS